ncbi:MAG: UbiA family prenyltransferase [Candidatus Nitrosocaldus sp.]
MRRIIPRIDKNSDNSAKFTDYLKCLTHYIRQRSQVYIFVASTLLSLAIASKEFEPILAIRLALGTYLISLATYAYNDVTDALADRINKVDRVLAKGKADDKTIKRISITLLLVGVILLIHINLYTAIVALTCTALAVAYSHPKTNLKDKFPYKTIVNATGAGLAALIGGFAADNLSTHVIMLAVISFLFLFVLAPLGDIQDYEGDKVAGKRTFPVVLGVNTTIAMMLPVPFMITLLLFTSINVNMLSIAVTSIANMVSTMVILLVYKRWHNKAIVKMSRHILRLMYIMNQVSIILSASNVKEI